MNNLYLGLMSGTSMDAIDIAAVNFDGIKPTIYATMSSSLPDNYRSRYLDIINAGNCNLNDFGALDSWSAELFATAILKFISTHNIDKSNILAIGSHGQTLWHAPKNSTPFTLQIGDPNVIAVRTGITTIADFRRADVAAGGCGAPLAPAFHQGVFASKTESRCIVNIGGYSNISVLENNKYLGFDCGPGNCLMDYWVQTHFNMEYDAEGAIASSGQVNTKLLEIMLADPYFKLAPPKSTGREHFNNAWLQNKITESKQSLSLPDVQATLLALTATCIADAIKSYATPDTTVYLCGGGAKNTALRNSLSVKLEQQVQTTDALGIDPAWVEAALFAWLAKMTFNGQAINLGSITGSQQPVILGGIYGYNPNRTHR